MSEIPGLEPVKLGEEFLQDPPAVYRELRKVGPAQQAILPNGWPGWLVTSYREARRLLADHRLSKDVTEAVKLFPPGNARGYESPLVRHMLHSDPPNHTRLRGLVSKAFTTRTVEQLRPRIEQIARELLDAMETAAREPGTVVDLMDAYALPLPITVICELLGVPAEDRRHFRDWTLTLVTISAPEELVAATRGLTGYLTSLIEAKRLDPADDLVSRLVHASDESGQLTPAELLNMTFLLLLGGFETTVNLIGNGVFALLRHPDQLALLRSKPRLLPNAVEEFLRYDGALHIATARFTKEPVPVGDTEIPAGQLVHVSLLAANRDGDRFDDPDKLDITRQPGHLAFGHGIHHCLGAPLARLEGQIAIGLLLDRFPDLSLAVDADELRWRESTLMHGLHALPVKVGQR
jgi:cytochrome P450